MKFRLLKHSNPLKWIFTKHKQFKHLSKKTLARDSGILTKQSDEFES